MRVVAALSAPESYRAPSRDGEALIVPPIGRVERLVADNRRRLAEADRQATDLALGALRRAARQQLLRAARSYTGCYRDVGSMGQELASDPYLVMAGHQPTLFHPGVWFKNFAIDRFAERLTAGSSGGGREAIAVNLVIDNDVSTASSIRVPFRDPISGLARCSPVAYDSVAGGVPFEQNRIQDCETFRSFAGAIRSAVGSLVAEPLIDRLWPHAVAAASRCENVACAIAQARHALEAELGLRTLELPLSVLCRGEPFCRFALAILNRANRFRQVYNGAASEYRAANRIRSSAHPVPDLGIDGNWVEVPFWIYADHSPQRRRAWVRVVGGRLEVSDRRDLSIRLSSRTSDDGAELAGRMGPEFKLRPRALVTTMFARLVLSDLFVHGIGGAKYDELGDVITARFFGVRSPAWMVVSATLLLPVDRRRITESAWSVSEIRRQLRRIRFAPESFAGEAELPEGLCQEKRELIAAVGTEGNKKAWHDRLDETNRRLAADLGAVRQQWTERLAVARAVESSEKILNSREYAFCLYPLGHLANHYSRLLSQDGAGG
ncbi:MAG: hypothetical protein EA381_18870 [Planctomycetaceae bacterium]|nr:MAG: hypothetical protein EA381_18870 [Planctomycetaceae bacterium]